LLQPGTENQDGESRQRHLPAPAPRLVRQSIRPFESQRANRSWSAGNGSRQVVERAPDPNCNTHPRIGEGGAISLDPGNLHRSTVAHQQNVRSTFPYASDRFRVIVLGGTACSPSSDNAKGVPALQRGYRRRGAQKEDASLVEMFRAQQPVREIDTGYPRDPAAIQEADRQHHTDPIRRREFGSLDRQTKIQ
jgi:hypothetical protein